ncbi:hypothetical protein BJ508DRAFT_417800 [Ascobolus immersus RN42]|uniref:Uncharacterized protein n=1 Tax=Ascobolus immersus RN42 TaxID=1160509 RepID=A0A3N4I284_ASCIM|nr:hypothetical protein BJ508DRAFT_417800 [Ascobolus immersus RN42]
MSPYNTPKDYPQHTTVDVYEVPMSSLPSPSLYAAPVPHQSESASTRFESFPLDLPSNPKKQPSFVVWIQKAYSSIRDAWSTIVRVMALLAICAVIPIGCFAVLFMSIGARQVSDLTPKEIPRQALVLKAARWARQNHHNDSSEELVALSTVNFDLFRIPGDHELRVDPLLEEEGQSIPKEVEFMRCLPSESIHYLGMPSEVQREVMAVFWGGDLRNCWLLTDGMLDIQRKWGPKNMEWLDRYRSDGTISIVL